MEQYSVDGRGRSGVYITIALAAIALAYVTRSAVATAGFVLPWWFDAPSFAGFYAAGNLIFDRWLWRVRIFGFRFSEIPDFGGDWEGRIAEASSADGPSDVPLTVQIRQTWTQISVFGRTKHGTTISKIAGVRIDDRELRYEYERRGNILHEHHVGFCVQRLTAGDEIEGSYYTLAAGAVPSISSFGTTHLHRAAPGRADC
ncbi:MAG TPA: hypothetical protein VMU38_04545 [Candidatus Binatia bacterium]|nr:hypothetical protein [Candidatus Binatia bacterium]